MSRPKWYFLFCFTVLFLHGTTVYGYEKTIHSSVGFKLVDVNMDSYLDISIKELAASNEVYSCWIYDPETGRYPNEVSLQLFNPEYDVERQQVVERINISAYMDRH